MIVKIKFIFIIFSLFLLVQYLLANTIENCEDTDERCPSWAELGECDANPHYMLISCAKSCNSCDLLPSDPVMEDVDTDQTCSINEEGSEVCIKTPKGANIHGKPIDASLSDVCKDRRRECGVYAKLGQCESAPGWMSVYCSKSCDSYINSCTLRDPKVRCQRSKLNITDSPIFGPGEMGNMFESIETDFTHYGITVHSRSPWIVTFDNFLSDAEITALIETVGGNWEKSTDTGIANEFGEVGRILSEGRTSSNAWCRETCENHPDVRSVINKIVEVTRVPYNHYESFQILQYDLGQKYNKHHDAGGSDHLLTCGPRILTFFLYLSDVEEGGETAFPDLGISVKPKKGKALLWPSVLDEFPDRIDHRTQHEARPVIRGKKYAANSWIHQYDFAQTNKWGCSGTFD